MTKVSREFFIGLGLSTAIVFLPLQSRAGSWKTSCWLGDSTAVRYECKETKGDAFLKGVEGYLHTFTFPNRKRFEWFYGSTSTLCQWKNTYVRQTGTSPWFAVSPACENDSIRILLPSGNTMFLIGYPDD